MVNLSYDIKHLYKFYTEIYAEFRIEVNDKQLENRIIKIMKQIGTINVQKTKLQTSLISSFTQVFKTPYVECVSNEFCDKLEPFIDDLCALFKNSVSIINKEIYFVILLGKQGVGITIDEPLIKIVDKLGLEINLCWQNIKN